MNKKQIIAILLFLTIGLIYVYKNTMIFKIFDVTKQTNTINANLPYIKYEFYKANVHKGIGNNYLFWEVSGATKDKDMLHEFNIREAYNLKYNFSGYYGDFLKRRIDLFGYTFLFFPKFHLNDVPKVVFSKDKDSIIIGLWNIQEFKDYYLMDGAYPNRRHDDIMGNLDRIPHIEFNLQ